MNDLETHDGGGATCTANGTDRSLLCRLGLHKWSTNRGGIKVCRRDDCRKAQTFGITGAMRKMEFEEDLYEDFQRYEDTEDDDV